MNIIETATVLKNAIAQSIGAEYMDVDTNDISAIESFKIADVGEAVLNSGSVEVATKALIQRLAKIVVDAKKYKGEIPSLFYDNFDWGGFVERVYYSPQDILEDDMWNLVDGQSYDDHIYYQPKVAAKIFQEAKAIVCPISITEEQLKTAFSGWEEMNKFISGIRVNIENTLELAMQCYAFMLMQCAIASAIDGTANVYHLGTLAVAKGIISEVPTNRDDLLENSEFMTFALKKVATIRKYLARYSTAFNNGTIPTFTSENESRLCLLTDFVKSAKFNVKANTYNKDEIAIGDFDEVAAWQAFRNNDTEFEFATNSTVEMSADANNKLGIGTTAKTYNNVVGVLYDHRAMGICPYRTKVTTNYTARADFWNEYSHVLVNYILDTNYPIVVFDFN